MAKNLKFKIKNTQLAEALQLDKLKKTKEEASQVAEKKKLPPKKKVAVPPAATEPPPPSPITEEIEVQVQPEPIVEIEAELEPTLPPEERKPRIIVDDFRKPKIIRKTAPPPPLKKLPVSRQDVKSTETKKPEEAPQKAAPAKPTEEPQKPGPFKDFHDVRSQRKPQQKRSFDSRDRLGLREDEDHRWRKKRPKKYLDSQREDLTIRPKELSIRLPISVKDLAVEMKLKASQLISKLFMQGMVVTINDILDDETTVQLLGHEFDCEISIDTSEEKKIQVTDQSIKQEVQNTDPSKLKLRPPVITFMGHVDHGKTSLIDAIRKSDIASSEAGAITQHIGAFKCHTAVGDLTILDTPGHKAFSAMRERGAVVTDLVVLVIAGDEGMRDQTIEAMNQAKEAKVPIVVSINKSDKPGFNAENVYRELSEHGLLPEAWGGETLTVNCSAKTGQGVKDLLEMLALQSEILELKASESARARGNVIESAMHKGLGPVATVLIQNGTLTIGDNLVFDWHSAKVKTMHDEYGKQLTHAGPSTPVKITGLSGLPEAGSEFIAVPTEKEAKEIAEARYAKRKTLQLQKVKKGLEGLLESKAAKAKKVLHIILRADVQGSLEALKHSLEKIRSDKIDLNIVSFDVGQISESDVSLAGASGAVILGFHTKVESHAEGLIKEKKVSVILHNIIYHAVDEVKELMRQKLDKIPEENPMGNAQIKALFKSSQLGSIAGCQVSEGLIKRNQQARVIRNGERIWQGTIGSLKRGKEDVREVAKGLECGILLNGFDAYKEGDTIETFEITYLEQELLSMANSKRIQRLNSLLKEVLSEVILSEVKDPRMAPLISVSDVDISKDLHHAKVYVSIIGSDKERRDTLEALESAAGFIGINAAKKVVMRYFPTLTFKLDTTVDEQMKIDALLDKIHQEEEKRSHGTS